MFLLRILLFQPVVRQQLLSTHKIIELIVLTAVHLNKYIYVRYVEIKSKLMIL